jgi:hypothetical protein
MNKRINPDEGKEAIRLTANEVSALYCVSAGSTKEFKVAKQTLNSLERKGFTSDGQLTDLGKRYIDDPGKFNNLAINWNGD